MSMSSAFGDVRKIGIGLTAFGVAFSGLGVLFFFEKGLLAMGNVLFLSGVCLIIGPSRSVRFFFQKKKAKGSAFFFIGMFLVLIGMPIIGVCLELFGFFSLFGDFIPVVITFCRRVPILGNILSLPPVKRLTDKFTAANKLPV